MQSRIVRTSLLTIIILILFCAFVIAQGNAKESYFPYIGNNAPSGLPVIGDISSTPTVDTLPVSPTVTTTPVPTMTGTPPAVGTSAATNTPMATSTATPTDIPTVVASPTVLDVTADVERLGNPFLAQYPGDAFIYPRNVWDMQLFANKIYLGSGNSSNTGPNTNAGPVDVWGYDLATTQFVNEYTVDEEQIDLFRVINNTLYIPGHDPKRERVGFYRLENGVWAAHENIANIQHVYGMKSFGTELFAALGGMNNAAVAVSTDNGLSWSNTPIGALRVYSLLAVSGKLYAAKGIYTDAGYEALSPEYKPELIGLYEYQGAQTFIARPDLKFSVLFPDYDGDINPDNPWHTIGKITRQVTFQDKLVYIGGNQFNDHQTLPFGLFATGPIEQAQRITLPDGALPWDTLVRDDHLYVLLGTKQADDSYIVSVISTMDLLNWTERFRFTSDTFARSFELTPAGDFLFGLGTGIPTGLELNDWSTWEMSPSAGDILRVPNTVFDAASNVATKDSQ